MVCRSSGLGLCDRGVESFDEFAVALGFADPAALFGVFGQCFGVGALGGKDGQVAGVGAEVGAVFANVGVGAGALGGGAQAEAAGEAGFDRWGVGPGGAAGDVGQRQGSACRGG